MEKTPHLLRYFTEGVREIQKIAPILGRRVLPVASAFSKMLMLALALFLLSTLVFDSETFAQERRRGGVPSLKVGFNRQMLSGYAFTLEDTGTTTKYTNSEPMQGNELVLEYVFFDRVSIELAGSITPLTRNYELTVAAVKVSVEEKSRTYLYGTNLYFNGASGNGFKYFVGLNTGSISAGHTYKGTGSALDAKSSAERVTLNGIKLGLDWVSDNAGARLSYGTLAGTKKVKDKPLTAWDQIYVYTAAMVTLGIFAFF